MSEVWVLIVVLHEIRDFFLLTAHTVKLDWISSSVIRPGWICLADLIW
jgi:hypothetical protein